MMTFELILAADGSVLDTAGAPDVLDYSLSYPYERWGVVVRYTSSDGLNTFTKCLARVDLSGSEDYRRNADYAVAEVCRELGAGELVGEFDNPEYLSDGPVIDISFESTACDGCDGSCGCGG